MPKTSVNPPELMIVIALLQRFSNYTSKILTQNKRFLVIVAISPGVEMRQCFEITIPIV